MNKEEMEAMFGEARLELISNLQSTIRELRSRLAEVEKERDSLRSMPSDNLLDVHAICDQRDKATQELAAAQAELLAAKAVVEAARDHKTWFLCLSYKQNKLLVENQTLEIASKNWEKATEYQPLDYGPLLYALNAYDAALGAKEGEG